MTRRWRYVYATSSVKKDIATKGSLEILGMRIRYSLAFWFRNILTFFGRKVKSLKTFLKCS